MLKDKRLITYCYATVAKRQVKYKPTFWNLEVANLNPIYCKKNLTVYLVTKLILNPSKNYAVKMKKYKFLAKSDKSNCILIFNIFCSKNCSHNRDIDFI